MPFDAFFNYLSELTGGMPPDHLKLILSVILTYPYAAIFNYLPKNPTIKHLFSIIITSLTFMWFHDQYIGYLHLFSISLFTYIVMYFRRDSWSPYFVFVACMAHMSWSHIVRQMKGHTGDTEFDHTAPQMVLTIKLTSFAFNVWDGVRPDGALSSYNVSKRITTFPTPIEYFGWVFFFGGFLAGPACEYMDYKNFVDMTVFEEQDRDGTKKIRKPSGLKPAIMKLIMSFIYIAYYTVIGAHYGMSTLTNKDFLESSLLYRLWYIQFSGFNTRIKYYIIWTMAEGSCILSGLGFNGYDPATGRALWNRVANIDVMGYETAQNCKELLESWNQRTNVWLRNYVYLRLTPIGKKPNVVSTFVTFGTSALWHGFYPGYYLTFATGAVTQQTAKTLRRNLRPLFLAPDLKTPLPSKKFYDIASWFVTQVTFNFVVIPFGVLELLGSYIVWRSVIFYVHIGIITVEGLNMIGLGRYLKNLQKRRIEAAGLRAKDIQPNGRVVVNELGVPENENSGGVQVGKGKVE